MNRLALPYLRLTASNDMRECAPGVQYLFRGCGGSAVKFLIEKQDREVVIRFEQLGGQAQAVIDAMGRCRQSAWACSSGECMKIADMETCADGNVLAVRLKPRPDAELSVAGLGECLKYHFPKDTQG